MEVARERNGEATRLDRILLLYKMVLDAINNDKVEETAKKIRQDLNLNIDDYHTAYSLYNKINQRKDVVSKVCSDNEEIKLTLNYLIPQKLLGSDMSYAYNKSQYHLSNVCNGITNKWLRGYRARALLRCCNFIRFLQRHC